MLLLITNSTKAQECSEAITQALSQPLKIATTLRQAARFMGEREFKAVIVDEQLRDLEPEETDYVVSQIGLATSIYINFGITGTERTIRQIRTALHRREKELVIARNAAEQQLRDQLKDIVTALFLSCEMAIQLPSIPPDVQLKIRTMHGLLLQIQEQIGIASKNPSLKIVNNDSILDT